MKFFTLDWWRGETDDSASAADSYQRHLNELEQVLPAQVVAFERSPLMHDSKLRSLEFDVADASLAITLDARDQQGHPVQLILSYRDVAKLESFADPKVGLAGPYGFGDLGYTEAHVQGELTQHCLLFSSGIELRITFASFSFDSEPQAPT